MLVRVLLRARFRPALDLKDTDARSVRRYSYTNRIRNARKNSLVTRRSLFTKPARRRRLAASSSCGVAAPENPKRSLIRFARPPRSPRRVEPDRILRGRPTFRGYFHMYKQYKI